MRCLPYLYGSVENPNNPIGLNSPPNEDQLVLVDSKMHFNNTFVGTTDPNYNEGFTSRLYMTNYINEIPNQRNNILARGNNNNNIK